MPPRQWLVSALIVAMIGLKLVEGALRIESWPLSNVPMFASYVARDTTPRRVILRGRTDGEWFDLPPAQLGLTDDEFTRRFAGTLSRVPLVCAELGKVYDASRSRGKLHALEARVVTIPRPGVPVVYGDVVVACPVDTSS